MAQLVTCVQCTRSKRRAKIERLDKTTTQMAKEDAGTFENFVLYIGPDVRDPRVFCPGSRTCLPLAEKLGDINIQNVRTLLDEGVKLPSWLTGTPMLVDMTQKQAYKGTDALNHLKKLSAPPKAQSPEDPPPSHDEMMGVLPSGEAHLHSDGFGGAEFTAPAHAHGESSRFTDEKLTEDAVQRYMDARNKASTDPSPTQ